MSQQNIVFVNVQEEIAQKRVKSLKFQLKALDWKNELLKQKIKQVNKIQLNNPQSPVKQLQDNLHLDRRQIIEIYKPIIDKEAVYIRNQRLQTEQYMMQSRINEFQQKKIRVQQIDQFNNDVIKKTAQYKENKVSVIRKRAMKEIEQNQLFVSNKMKFVNQLQDEQKQLNALITQAQENSKELNYRFRRAISSSQGVNKLPKIRQMSQNQSFFTPNKNANSHINLTNIFDSFEDYTNSDKKISQSIFLNRKQSKSTNNMIDYIDASQHYQTPQWAVDQILNKTQHTQSANKENYVQQQNS